METAERTFYTSQELADHLRMSSNTLSGWRYRGIGPRFVKVGKKVLYRPADVDAWLEEQTRQGTADAHADA